MEAAGLGCDVEVGAFFFCWFSTETLDDELLADRMSVAVIVGRESWELSGSSLVVGVVVGEEELEFAHFVFLDSVFGSSASGSTPGRANLGIKPSSLVELLNLISDPHA